MNNTVLEEMLFMDAEEFDFSGDATSLTEDCYLYDSQGDVRGVDVHAVVAASGDLIDVLEDALKKVKLIRMTAMNSLAVVDTRNVGMSYNDTGDTGSEDSLINDAIDHGVVRRATRIEHANGEYRVSRM